MKNTFIKVGVAIPAVKDGNPKFNCENIVKLIKENSDVGILVFPELSLSGYYCQDLFLQDKLLSSCLEELKNIKEATKGLNNTVLVGLPLKYKNKLYNTACVISNGEIIAFVPKANIPNYGEFYENRWFASGKDLKYDFITVDGKDYPLNMNVLFDDGIVSLGVEICEDLWVVDAPFRKALLAGGNIIANLSGSNERIGKSAYRRNLVSQASAEGFCTYLYSSCSTGESSTDLVFSGHSIIADNGVILNETIYPKDNTVITSIVDLEKNQFNRIHQSTYKNDEGDFISLPIKVKAHLFKKDDIEVEELTSALKEENYYIERMPFVPKDDEQRKNRCLEILTIQAQGLATRVRNTNIKNLIIGVSGGLDSTLALLVAYETSKLVEGVQIYGITMPNDGNTSSLTYTNALKLMKELNINYEEINISKGVKQHLKDLNHPLEYLGEKDTTYENAQARYRTYILMDKANMLNGLVVGTGDLSELALGWCTYNGDHMSMYAVNASIPKTLVKYMVETYAYTLASEDLKETLLSITSTPISPELTPTSNGQIAQKTEEKIGKYDLNDFFLYYFLRFGFSPAKIIALTLLAYPELDKEQVKDNLRRFYKRFFSQQFKRSCLPDGPKVGSVTLSPRGDHRMPSDASPDIYLKEIEEC